MYFIHLDQCSQSGPYSPPGGAERLLGGGHAARGR